MVSKLFRPGKNGVSDWIIQRMTSVILALYIIFLLGVFLFVGKVDYSYWKNLFSCWAVQVFTLFALASLLLHAWVGVWTVLSDYIKCASLRFSLLLLLILSLSFYLVWGIKILWGEVL